MRRFATLVTFLLAASTLQAQATSSAPAEGRPAAGFSGLWSQAKPADAVPCRGPCATFSPYHVPDACYSKAAGKTFFVYGASAGVQRGGPVHQIAISCFDHTTGLVHRPTILMDSPGRTATGNPTLAIDKDGYLWVFVSGAVGVEGAVFRGTRPYDISSFERLASAKFEFPQPWAVSGGGFLAMSLDAAGKLVFSTSDDGRSWATAKAIDGRTLAVSAQHDNMVGAVVATVGKDGPAGPLAYIESPDGGKTWTTVDKKPLTLPLPADLAPTRLAGSAAGPVSLKDLTFDARGNPVALYLAAGPVGSGKWVWTVAHWTGREWETGGLIDSDDAADSGALYIEPQGVWRLIAPTDPGHDRGPGGEIVSWTSDDQGRSWRRKPLTHASPVNHNWVRRPVNAQPDFYALWSAGSLFGRSDVDLYFCTRDGEVFRLPRRMNADAVRPERVALSGSTAPASRP
jgi:hypothetical protein